MKRRSQAPAGMEGREFAEHLRTVHFALVLTMFALLAGSLLTKSADAERALEQLKEISDLQSTWKPEWPELEASKVVDRLLTPIAPDWVDSRNERVHLGTRWFINLPTGAKDEHGEFIGGWESYKSPEGGDSRRFRSKSLTHLSDFKKFWNSLAGLQIIAAESISEQAVIWAAGKEEIYPPSYFWPATLKSGKGRDGGLLFNTALKISSPPLIQWIQSEPRLASLANDIHPSGVTFSGDVRPHFAAAILIPARLREIKFDGQLAFQTAHSTKFHYGTFEEILPELDKFTKNFQDLPYNRLRIILEGEASRTSERVEMFGAKIPGDALATWGIPVVVLLQFYLLLHLSTFRLLASDWSGLPTVAWIGLYPSWSARLTTIFSAAVLPLSITGYILFEQKSKFLHWWEWSFAALATLVSLIIGVMSVVLLLGIWRTFSVNPIQRQRPAS